MEFQLRFSEKAKLKLQKPEADKSKSTVLKQVRKILGFMETDLKHLSLNTHKFNGIECFLGDVFETYVQNRTPGAYRIFRVSGPGKESFIYWILLLIHKMSEKFF